MPLLDHFHPPLFGTRHWESFHSVWANSLAERLNVDLLPAGYFAEIQVHVGGRVEVDIGAFEKDSPVRPAGSSAVATLEAPSRVWAPPSPDISFPAIFPDAIELLVFNGESGPTLVGAVEFVSPGNKDRPEARRAFAAKSASYLQEGVGLVVVDVVTSRRSNLHNALVDLLGIGDAPRMADDPPLYATAYRPARRPDGDSVDAWLTRLAVGEGLPTLPLALRGGPCLPIELESSYAEACRRARLA
jgi:hypothetical protein